MFGADTGIYLQFPLQYHAWLSAKLSIAVKFHVNAADINLKLFLKILLLNLYTLIFSSHQYYISIFELIDPWFIFMKFR